MVSLPCCHQYLTTLYRLSEGFVGGGPDNTDIIPRLAVRPIMRLVSPPGQFSSDIDSHTDAFHRTHGMVLKHTPPYHQLMDNDDNTPPATTITLP